MTSWPKPNAYQVAAMLRQNGFLIKNEGAEIKCACPHPSHSNQDKDPCLCIDSATGAYTCHGGKHPQDTKSGDFYDLARLVGKNPADWAREIGVSLKVKSMPVRGKVWTRPNPVDDLRGFTEKELYDLEVTTATNWQGNECWLFHDDGTPFRFVVKHSARAGMKEGDQKCLYPKGHKKVFWPAVRNATPDDICYLTEAEFGAASLSKMTGKQAFATGGGFKKKNLTDFLKLELFKKIILVPDSDDGGSKWLNMVTSHMVAEGYEVWGLMLPPGFDANDLLVSGLAIPDPQQIIENVPGPDLDTSKSGVVLKTPPNLLKIMECQFFKDTFGSPWINSMGRVPMLGRTDYLNVHAIRFRHWIADEFDIAWPKDEIHDTYSMVAHSNMSSPVNDYLMGLRWDGMPRLDRMLDSYFTLPDTEDSDLKGVYIKKWMISAVARALEPGCKVDSMIVLVSPKQGIGKSSFARALGGDWFLDGQLDPESKDCTMILHKHWIAELSELDATTRKKDMAHLRAFISRQEDDLRVPYGRVSETFKRAFVFIGTTNDEAVIREKEARRYWPIKVDSIAHREVAEDRDQLWAEAVHLWNTWISQGKLWEETPWVLTPEEVELHRDDTASKFTPEDTLLEILTEWVESTMDSTERKSNGYKFEDFTKHLSECGQNGKPSKVISDAIKTMGLVRGVGRKRRRWFSTDRTLM